MDQHRSEDDSVPRREARGLDSFSSLPEAVLTVPEIARELRCSSAHVYNVINGLVRGVSPLPAISLGRRKLILRSSLEQWKRVNERASSSAIMIASQRSMP
jgi:hypothetical protein